MDSGEVDLDLKSRGKDGTVKSPNEVTTRHVAMDSSHGLIGSMGPSFHLLLLVLLQLVLQVCCKEKVERRYRPKRNEAGPLSPGPRAYRPRPGGSPVGLLNPSYPSQDNGDIAKCQDNAELIRHIIPDMSSCKTRVEPRLEQQMYTLHKLKAARKRPHEEVEDSTFGDTRTALQKSPEREIYHPKITNDTYPWGFEQEDLERFPALRRRNFWCIQRHQARGKLRLLIICLY